MQSKANRRTANVVAKARRPLMEIFRTQPGQVSSAKFPPWFAIIAVIFGWVVVAGVVGLGWLTIGLL